MDLFGNGWIALILTVVSTSISTLWANIDTKEHFCGNKLAEVLADLCAIYYSPMMRHNRYRRQIVQECCHTQCSRRYLLQYYCFEPKSSVIAQLGKSNRNNSSNNAIANNVQADSAYITNSRSNNNEMIKKDNQFTAKVDAEKRFYGVTKRKCKCKRKRVKRIKPRQVLKTGKNLKLVSASIGFIENSQQPFYVWKSVPSKMVENH